MTNVFLINTKESCNVMNISEDLWDQDMMEWGSIQAKTKTIEDTTPAATQAIHTASQ